MESRKQKGELKSNKKQVKSTGKQEEIVTGRSEILYLWLAQLDSAFLVDRERLFELASVASCNNNNNNRLYQLSFL